MPVSPDGSRQFSSPPHMVLGSTAGAGLARAGGRQRLGPRDGASIVPAPSSNAGRRNPSRGVSPAQVLNGLRRGTANALKSAPLLVATVRPWTLAVAAIIASS